MKLYFYRDDRPNFGDELNHFLMPKVFGDVFDEDLSRIFLGIGSVLFDFHPMNSDKVVFGSGFGGYTAPPQLNDRWKIFCVRGHLTSRFLGLDESLVAGDSAILIKNYIGAREKTFAVSFMPHYDSLNRGVWRFVANLAGINFIDPGGPVEGVLDQIAASSVVITEAMHGAIVADALRTPWIPLMPIAPVHRMKWFDWSSALSLELRPYALFPSSYKETKVGLKDYAGLSVLEKNELRLYKILNSFYPYLAASRLYYLSRVAPMMSTDAALGSVVERLENAAYEIKRTYFL